MMYFSQVKLLLPFLVLVGIFCATDTIEAKALHFSHGELAGDFVKEIETERIWYVDPVLSRRYQISEKDEFLFDRLLNLAQEKTWPMIVSIPEAGLDAEILARDRIGLMGIVHDVNNPLLLWHIQKRAYKRHALKSKEDILEYAQGAMEVEAKKLYEYPIHYSDFEYVIADPKDVIFPQADFASTTGGKHITVSIKEQRLRAYENGRLTNTFLISSGKTGFWTKKGLHSVLSKRPIVVYAWSYGLNHPDNYDLGPVPYNLMIYRHTYIHYAYWHNNFGRSMSRGCINVNLDNMKWIYRWADEGVSVLVY